jgi:hypothetical protein
MYKEKYIKYKTKYLELKSQLDSGPNIIQEGGNPFSFLWSFDKEAAGKKAVDEKAKTVKEAADKAAADKVAAEKAAAVKAAADKAAADKAAADKAAADKVAADKVVADKVAADKAVGEKVVANNKIIEQVKALFTMSNVDFNRKYYNWTRPDDKSNEDFMRILRISFHWLIEETVPSVLDILKAIEKDEQADEKLISTLNNTVFEQFKRKGEEENILSESEKQKNTHAQNKRDKEAAERMEIINDANEKARWAKKNMTALKNALISDELKLVYAIIFSYYYYYQNENNFFKDYYGVKYDKLSETKQQDYKKIETITKILVEKTTKAELVTLYYDHQIFHLELMVDFILDIIKKEDILLSNFSDIYNKRMRGLNDSVLKIYRESTSQAIAYKKIEDINKEYQFKDNMEKMIEIKIKNLIKKKLDKKIKNLKPEWIDTTTKDVKNTTTKDVKNTTTDEQKEELRSTDDGKLYLSTRKIRGYPSILPNPRSLPPPETQSSELLSV